MIATDILREEHRIILSVLRALEKICEGIDSGARVDKELGEKIVSFIREFADACHHGKEEARLFKWMRRRQIGMGPVGMLEEEHETGRSFVRAMHGALDAGDHRRFGDAARGWIDMLRTHIDREDNGVFVIADDVVQTDDDRSLIDAYAEAEAEAGGHRHSAGLALAREICDAANVPCVTLRELPNISRYYLSVPV
jgi:hemerythrin-like domain-containing protein